MFDLESLRHVYLRRVVGTVAGAVGFTATARVARYFGEAAFGLNTLARRRAEARVMAALGSACKPDRARAIIRDMYSNWGRFWAEAMFTPRLLRDSSWRQFVSVSPDDFSTLTNLTSGQRGCIFAAGYFGNPAVLVDALGRLARPIYVVVDFLAQPHLRRWQGELYSRPHVRPVERASAGSIIPSVLSKGGSVLLIAEHERRKGRAIACDYLGSRINAYPTIARLARHHEVPVATVSCKRVGDDFNFELNVGDVFLPSAMEDEAASTRRILKSLEDEALQAPEQYLWSVPIGIPLSQIAADAAQASAMTTSRGTSCADAPSAQFTSASVSMRSVTLGHWNGNRIGVVPNHTSNRVGVAMAVSGGQKTAGGGSSGAN